MQLFPSECHRPIIAYQVNLRIKKDFLCDREEDVRGSGCATGRQSEGKIELL